jgi:ABC-type multidrug transport system fused ATPase/permease subunit
MASLVPQHFYVLDDTIRRNVAFGLADEQIDDARVWRALELARIDARVKMLPGGLDAVVKEGGALLSGGERQRLAIARALFDDPDLLVLDEATSALDSATEAEIMETLRAVSLNRIVVMVTHRLANLAVCDRVLVIREGRLVADIPPREADWADLNADLMPGLPG